MEKKYDSYLRRYHLLISLKMGAFLYVSPFFMMAILHFYYKIEYRIIDGTATLCRIPEKMTPTQAISIRQ